jgi:lauroyl/myristoyl acyltransferase
LPIKYYGNHFLQERLVQVSRIYRIFHRKPLSLSKTPRAQNRLGRRLLPYTLLLRLQHFFLPKPWVQNLFFSRQVRRIRDLSSTLPGADTSRIILASLMVNTFQHWRRSIFLDTENRNQWIKAEGLEKVEKALNSKRGVIIVITHAIGRHLFGPLLNAHFPVDIYAIGPVDPRKGKKHVTTTMAFQFAAAVKHLQSGGIVFIAGEGARGQSYLELPLLGRMFPFRSGFAELAARTGAIPLAIFSNLNMDGSITFELDNIHTSKTGTRQEQVDALVRCYAAMLRQREQQLLSSLRWGKVEQITTFPPVA